MARHLGGAHDAEVGGDAEEDLLLAHEDEAAEGHGQRVISGHGLRVRRTVSHAPVDDTPVLAAAVEAFAEDEQHRSPMLDGGDLPLRALAQGLSMLSLDELRRLRLPTLPWQTGDDGQPSMLENLRRKPWKAHYTSLMGFVLSTGAFRSVQLRADADALPPPACPPGALIAHLWCAVVACLLIVFVSQARARSSAP